MERRGTLVLYTVPKYLIKKRCTQTTNKQMGNRTGSKRKEQQARDDDLPLWGVPLSFLKDWTKKNVNENQTTAQVCQDIILLLTKKRRCSFLDGVDIPKVKANRFISHSWSYSKGLLNLGARVRLTSMLRCRVCNTCRDTCRSRIEPGV